MAHNVFISYSSHDKVVADAVCVTLEKNKIRCWIAPRDVPPGQTYGGAIIRAIDESWVFVLVFSANANRSPQVMREVERAVTQEIPIIPFRIEDVQPSEDIGYFIGSIHWLDALTPPLERHTQKLSDTVLRLLTEQGEPQPSTMTRESPPTTKPEPPTVKPTPKPPTGAGKGKQIASVIGRGMQIASAVKMAEQIAAAMASKPPTRTTNPFTFGNPIQDPTHFYGRKGDIRQIVNRLLSSAHESTSIAGERRIGKTSLLYHLSNPDVAASLGLPEDEYCLVYIDFQGLTDITPHRFWQRILHKMSRSICEPNLVPTIDELRMRDTFDLFDMEDLFEVINNHGITVVFFMDEFEYVTQNPNFGADFFGGLRALAIHYDLALVPATRRELVDLCHSEEIKGSPFFNIFANVVLKPFMMAEVNELIDGYVEGKLFTFTPEEKAFVIQLGGGHPFFVQIAGYYIVEGKLQDLKDEALISYVTTEFDQQADPHFEYYWSHCSESEKITLLAILALCKQKPTKKTVPTLENLTQLHSRASIDIPQLIRRCLVEEVDGNYRLLSQGLERWIAREITSTPGEQETQASVEEWLDGGGRENLQPVKGALPKFKKRYWPIVGNILKEMSFEVMGAAAFELIVSTLI